jgi:hypothetical protein
MFDPCNRFEILVMLIKCGDVSNIAGALQDFNFFCFFKCFNFCHSTASTTPAPKVLVFVISLK